MLQRAKIGLSLLLPVPSCAMEALDQLWCKPGLSWEYLIYLYGSPC